VRRGLVRSRHEASDLIRQGRVSVAGVDRPKPATAVAVGADIEVLPGPRFVSRAGYKLEAALTHFQLEVAGKRALDVGAAAGGFTDCLLQRGAAEVVAVDVGRGQFSPLLASHPQVQVWEGTDVRTLKAPPFPLVVVDVSFIPLCDLAADLARLTEVGGDLLALVKPQFEVGRPGIKRGVVRAVSIREDLVEKVRDCFGAARMDTVGMFDSPLTGEQGNQETFLWARRR
jgi:23S rRNA (cytidine1920-2'-O)/16S rRNA (cytidine1409-2'-O)-methyltransferase